MTNHNITSGWIDEKEWHIKRKESIGHQYVYKHIKFNEITINRDYLELLDINTECSRMRSIEPIRKLSLNIPTFHFYTTGFRIKNKDDEFKGYIVYCIYNGATLLYVGRTYMLRTRIMYHHLEFNFFNKSLTVQGYFVRSDADLAIYELLTINILKPVLNKQRVYTY